MGRADPIEEFQARVEAALDKLVAEHAGDTIAVVCHGGVINLYLAVVLGLTGDDRTGFFYPNYTSIHRVAASRSGCAVDHHGQRDITSPQHRPADGPVPEGLMS